jgi:tRNA 2-thiouridine synthesizing protein A
MAEVDARGFSCPIPVVKTKKAMDDNPEDAITVLLDGEVAVENVSRLAESRGYAVASEDVSGDYKLILTPPGN